MGGLFLMKTISDSIYNIKKSFVEIHTAARDAERKFAEEGKPYIFAAKTENNRKNSEAFKDASSFFSQVSKKYSDQSQIDRILPEVKTEKDRALQDYELFRLKTLTLRSDDETIGIFKNSKKTDFTTGIIDEEALKTVNDEVRLINSHEYQTYKLVKNRPDDQRPKRVSDEQKRQVIIRDIKEKKEASRLRQIHSMPSNKSVSYISLKDSWASCLGPSRIAAIVIVVLYFVLLIGGAIFQEHIDEKYLWILEVLKAPGVFVIDVFDWIGEFFYQILPSGLFLFLSNLWETFSIFTNLIIVIVIVMLAVFLIGLTISSLCCVPILIINGVKAIIQLFWSAKNKIANDKYMKAESDFDAYFNRKYAAEIQRRLKEWNLKEEKEQAAFITKDQAARDYYDEIARISVTSKPILTTLLDNLQIIERNIGIIELEIDNIMRLSNSKYVKAEALKCYQALDCGDVETYDQAIEMQEIIAKADYDRYRRKAEADRKAYEEKLEQQRRDREYEEKRQREREQKRLEEEQRQREHDAKMAYINRTNAILASALAITQSINEQNELDREANELLEELNSKLNE